MSSKLYWISDLICHVYVVDYAIIIEVLHRQKPNIKRYYKNIYFKKFKL